MRNGVQRNIQRALWEMAAFAPERYFAPRYVGLEHIDPHRPSLYVANHTMYGVIDAPLFMAELHRRGVHLRALADRLHYRVPLWRDLLTTMGAVNGSREICGALMEQGEDILVFPGGGREVCKRRGEAYQLIWKQRTGFTRLALKHGYPIVPIAALGADEIFEIALDADDVLDSPLGALMRRIGPLQKLLRGGENIFPVGRGVANSPLPRPLPFYFAFGPPIELQTTAPEAITSAQLFALRQRVADQIYEQLDALRQLRAREQARWPAWRRALLGALMVDGA